MCTGEVGKNQTHTDVHKFFSEKRLGLATFDHRNELGTGIFSVADPENGIMEEKKILVKEISYKETVKRGQNCLSFSFVPSEMMSFDDILQLSCRENCSSSSPCPTPGCHCGGFGCY